MNITQLACELKSLEKPFMMLMIGLPGSGKSSVLTALLRSIPFHVASTDDILMENATKNGWSYAEAHQKSNFKDVKKQMNGQMMAAFARHENVVNDQTNLASKKRRATLIQAPKDYVRIGVMLDCEMHEIIERLNKRETETGKLVPINVVTEMLKRFTAPSKSEGFDFLWDFQGDPRLSKN